MGVIDMHQADKKRCVACWPAGATVTVISRGVGWASLGFAFSLMAWGGEGPLVSCADVVVGVGNGAWG